MQYILDIYGILGKQAIELEKGKITSIKNEANKLN